MNIAGFEINNLLFWGIAIILVWGFIPWGSIFGLNFGSKKKDEDVEEADDSDIEDQEAEAEETEEEEESEEDEEEPERECAFQDEWDDNYNEEWNCGISGSCCDKSICPYWKDEKQLPIVKKKR